VPINPTVPLATGDPTGIATALADLQRRVGSLEGGGGGTSIGAGSISGDLISPHSISTPHIAVGGLDAGIITTGQLDALYIDTAGIAADSAFVNTLSANTSFINTVSANAVTASSITSAMSATNVALANTIVAQMVNANSAYIWNLTTGKLRVPGTTGTVEIGDQVGPTGAKFDGIVGYDSTNAITFKVDAATGGAEFKGLVKAGSSGLGNISGTLDPTGVFVDNTIPGGKIVTGSITSAQFVSGIAGSNILAVYCDTNFERTDGYSLKGWANADQTAYYVTSGITSSVRSTTQKHEGLASLAATVNATSRGVCTIPIPGPTNGVWKTGVAYTASVWVYGPTSMTLVLGFGNADAATLTANDYTLSTATTQNSTWKRLTATWTPTADRAAAYVFIRTSAVPAGTSTFYVDEVQAEVGPLASQWTGLGPGQVAGTEIAGDSITTGHLQLNSITASRIAFTMGGLNLFRNAGLASNRGNVATGYGTPDFDYWAEYPGYGQTSSSILITVHDVTDTSEGLTGVAQKYLRFRRLSSYGSAGTSPQVGLSHAFTAFTTKMLPGHTYTASAYACGDAGGAGQTFEFYYEYQVSGVWQAGIQQAFALPNDKVLRRYSWTFTVPSNFNDAFGRFYMWCSDPKGNNRHIYVSMPQLEEGDVQTTWKQGIDPTVIDGGSITAAVFKTNQTGTRLQIDDTNGYQAYNSNALTSQMKAGYGGLDMLTSTLQTPPEYQRVRWLGSLPNGGKSGDIWASTYGAASAMDVSAYIYGTNFSTSRITAWSSNSYAAQVTATAPATYTNAGGYSVTANAGGLTKTIIDGVENSSFLQLQGSATRRKVLFGSGSIVWGNQSTQSYAYYHGQGANPSYVFLTGRYNSLFYNINCVGLLSYSGDQNTVTFAFQTYDVGNVNGTSEFSFMLVW
jgi:hypothetical protein